jgi:putative ABC transport system substrate-binding protein
LGCTALRLALLLLLAVSWPRASYADGVALLLSERGGAYVEIADAIRRELGPAAGSAQFVLPEIEALAGTNPRLAVAIGTQACAALAASRVAAPLLCTLLPRAAFERIAASAGAKGRGFSALVMDQPLARQLALVRLAFPERRRVGALLGPESSSQSDALAAAAAQHGLRLGIERVESATEIHADLQRLLDDSEILLALPDGLVFNAATAQNILRASIQKRVPMVAFSPAYARAGAVLALYSTPAQMGAQVGQWLRGALAGRPLPRPQSPRQFEIAINRQVARALGHAMPAEAELAGRLRRAEDNP